MLSIERLMNSLFIVGAQRCGTTLLHKVLDTHPEVIMAKPVRPEPKFFLDRVDADYSRQSFVDRLFDGERSIPKYYGEKSTSYIDYEYALKRIRSTFQDSKIILM